MLRKILMIGVLGIQVFAQDWSPYRLLAFPAVVLRINKWSVPEALGKPSTLVLESDPLTVNAKLPTYFNAWRRPQGDGIAFYTTKKIGAKRLHSSHGGLSGFMFRFPKAEYKEDHVLLRKGDRWVIQLNLDPARLAEWFKPEDEVQQPELVDVYFQGNNPKEDGYVICMPVEEQIKFWEAFRRAAKESQRLLASSKPSSLTNR